MDDDPVLTPAASLVGRVLKNKWRLERLLGVGGMSVVYEACHRNGARFAIKILQTRYSADPELRKRFQREGYLANAVGHPGAVAVSDDDEEDGLAFLVMELLSGESVETLRTSLGGKLSVRQALEITESLLAVLSAAHDKRIIHRDIKPANLFLTKSAGLKVLDFGIAAAHDPMASVLTKAGAIMGTPAFMSPEQAQGDWDRVDHRSDLFSTGATLFTLLSGEPVHVANTGNQQFALTMTVQARSLKTVLPNAPAAVVALVDRALRFDVEDRFQSAAAMRSACLEALAGLDEQQTVAGVATDPTLKADAFLTQRDIQSAVVGQSTAAATSSSVQSTQGDKNRGFKLWRQGALVALLLATLGVGFRLASERTTAPKPESAAVPAVKAEQLSNPERAIPEASIPPPTGVASITPSVIQAPQPKSDAGAAQPKRVRELGRSKTPPPAVQSALPAGPKRNPLDVWQ